MSRIFGPQTGPSGAGTISDVEEAVSTVIQGRLEATPAYYQTDSDEAVQLDSADDALAVKLVLNTDMEIQAFSRFITAVATQGSGAVTVCDNASKPEPNGDLNGSDTAAHADQTDNSTPLTVSATSEDSGGTNQAYKAFGGSNTTYWKSDADPASTPQELEIDFGAGNEKVINKVIITAANEASADGRCFPKTFTIQGHDGDSYSTLKTVASSTDPGDQGKQVYTWENSTELQKVKINITDNHGTGAFVCVGEIEWIEAQDEDAPGTELKTILAAADSGNAADAWKHNAIATADRYQCLAGKIYWVKEKGVAGKDYSLSVRRWNTKKGSMFPDMFVDCKKSTDGGTTWTQAQQDSKPAMWNIMINAVEAEAGKPVPQLMYGRYNGKNIYIPGSGSCDIPEGGIYLDLSDHSSPDSKFGYHVWARNNAGTLELSATTDDIASTDGIKHKTSASGYRYLGDVYPVAIHTGHYGPVFCQDRRLVWNQFNKKKVSLGKRNPYASNTSETITVTLYGFQGESGYWRKWRGDSDDWFIDLLLGEPSSVDLVATCYKGSAEHAVCAIGVNGKITQAQENLGGSYNIHQPFRARLTSPFLEGYTTLVPMLGLRHNDTTIVYWGNIGTGLTGYQTASLVGFVEM
jgi:hypothetical protein